MIFLPPDELLDYIESDENGKWIHSKDMPEELFPVFRKFTVEAEEVLADKIGIFNEARREF